MSTRGCIARITSKEGEPITFKGRYHHWDSYPSGLGATLYGLWRGHFKRDTEAMLTYLMSHKAGWSTIQGCDFNLPAGYVDFTKVAHGPVCYCHGQRSEEGFDVDEKNAAESGVEYVYAFTNDDRMLILSSYKANGKKMIGMFGCGDPDAVWHVIGEIKLGGKTPNWDSNEEIIQPPSKRILKKKVIKPVKAKKVQVVEKEEKFETTDMDDLMG